MIGFPLFLSRAFGTRPRPIDFCRVVLCTKAEMRDPVLTDRAVDTVITGCSFSEEWPDRFYRGYLAVDPKGVLSKTFVFD